MRNDGWREKEINSILGSWAELQNLTGLYSKDANIYASMSPMKDEMHGYVEPVPAYYAHLDSLNRRMIAHFDAMDLWNQIEADSTNSRERRAVRAGERAETVARERAIRPERKLFEEFSEILQRLEALSRAALNGEPQSVDDGFFLKGLYRRLMFLSFNRSGTNVAMKPMSVIATVASEYQSKTSLQVGVGKPWVIYVAVPAGNRKIVCRGAIYSYYEMVSPIDRRLTDEEWVRQAMTSDPADRLPWLARPGGLAGGPLSRADLLEMMDYRGPDRFRLGLRQSIPHRWTHVQARTVVRKDLDLLVTMSRADTLNSGVREVVMTRMADYGKDPRVLEEFTRQVVNQAPSRYDAGNDPAFFMALRGLGYCGRRAEPVLDQALTSMADWPPYVRSLYEEQVQVSRETIRMWPDGRDAAP